MTRSLLLGLAVLALPAAAQTTDSTDTLPDPVMSGPMMADTTTAAFVPNPSLARPLYDEGLALGRAGTYADALLKYEESLLNDPAFAPSAFGRAQALAQLGRLDDAQSAFEQAIAAARAADNRQVVDASERGLAQVQDAITARDVAASASASAQAASQTMTDAVTEATTLLNADPVTPEAAQQAYDALERARAAGYDPNLVAFYYAKALVALDRGADAVPYAQTALDAADPSADRSGQYIQLGLAQRSAGDTAAARASFESAREGSWSGWADHYLREMDAPATDG